MLRTTLLALLALATLVIACESESVENRAATAGGTPAPDGASGYCCPARMGGCALVGGYREEGVCPTTWDLCDNLCEQAIVKDAHGCDVFTYKPCSGINGPPAQDAGSEGGPDASGDAHAAAVLPARRGEAWVGGERRKKA